MRTSQWLAAAITVALVLPAVASAQTSADVARVQQRYEHEPSVAQTTRKALEYFRVDPDSFDGLRSSARNRAWMPLLAAGYRFDDDQFDRFEDSEGTMTNVFRQNETTDRRVNSATVGLVWDLRELVFNPAEVQVYGLIGVQRDLMLEVTRTYYLRRQLMLRLALRAPEDPLARAALQLRIDEFTAILDVLTGGWFSRTSDERLQEKRGG